MSEQKIKYYDWIPFFKAICQKIIDHSLDVSNRDNWLLERAHEIFKPTDGILQFETTDPFSFIYALAQRNTRYQKEDIFRKTQRTFDIGIDIPTDTVFPTPTPNTKSLFFNRGKYENKNNELIGNDYLWNLFVQVFKGVEINENDFTHVLSLKNVGFTKLSQAMFLVNPTLYIPFDKQMNSLPMPELGELTKLVSEVERKGISPYLAVIDKLKNSFKGCELYEINLLNVLINSPYDDYLKLSNQYCQISSNIDGQQGNDYFDSFVKDNAVYTGGSGEHRRKEYPLTKYNRGDVVLVRRGTRRLGGIAIILKNEYIYDGFTEDAKLNVVWLIKDERRIESTALGQWDGFSHATEATISKFKECYPETFTLLNNIRNKQQVMINHSHIKFKNLILQGPPGTGKTRLAKQIAEWLTDDNGQKDFSLIEAIESNYFQKEPDIEDNAKVKIIQFHPSYTYDDFVRGIKVNVQGDRISYDVENKVLATIAEEASLPENTQKAYVLIIDEINRANLNSVLGELIYALEYRGKSVTSIYKYGESNEIMLPHNLYIIGTMNTADRSVSHLDYAIRRRFTFIPVVANPDAIENLKAKSLFNAVQELIKNHISPEFQLEHIQIGHSYFLVGEKDLEIKLKYEIKPLLQEYISDGLLLPSAKNLINDLNV